MSNKTWRPAQASVRRRRGIIFPSPLWTAVDVQHQQPSTGCGQFRLLSAGARRENSDPCGTRRRAAYNQHDSRSPPDIFIQHSSIASTWLCMNICDPGGCTRHSSRIAAANRAPHGPTCMHVTKKKTCVMVCYAADQSTNVCASYCMQYNTVYILFLRKTVARPLHAGAGARRVTPLAPRVGCGKARRETE